MRHFYVYWELWKINQPKEDTEIHSSLNHEHFFPIHSLNGPRLSKVDYVKVEMNYDKAKSHKEFEDYSTKTAKASNMYLTSQDGKKNKKKNVSSGAGRRAL